ncbi:pyridoxamine 5'-phosphate oxidase family protein [Actinomycetospora endophytica]|uniref:Pyridoxamine 5'-phosphate oxidase family protein n=1 Tax=Actinomycetospora endophytica TaxID=2291215 RepID=A0ABS8P988_9PSEU|nr:pyridoxamine 5'-phosphate oxidase family protein [Actinomycetospora endophytica]MCD2194497.1 pyridoxamine 5'-phosphate oxidase family protein [Actinomycetospora endophytica]
MTSWSEVEQAAPEPAAAVRELLGRGKHKTMATLRRDGSPRLSGIETEFHDGELTLGMMPGSRKLADVQRDPRVALHSPSVDPPEDDPTGWPGEAKVAGRLHEIGRPGEGPDGSYFALDVTEIVLTRIAPSGDRLIITSWRPGGQVREVERT